MVSSIATFLDRRYTTMLMIRERVACCLMNGSMAPGMRLKNQFRVHVEYLELDSMIYEGCNDGKPPSMEDCKE